MGGHVYGLAEESGRSPLPFGGLIHTVSLDGVTHIRPNFPRALGTGFPKDRSQRLLVESDKARNSALMSASVTSGTMNTTRRSALTRSAITGPCSDLNRAPFQAWNLLRVRDGVG
ncbi:hypothetical protein SAMN04489740_2461 [Arthrobacter alpinus]|uniref:Uncharacterized protein n=1 Tax=Arthrobacter alpinus TaxID=656366 RepID=A0A1H5LH71_9MICC|nr:hypothetical protein SAMN04489740_2461 [Arthrobacter alpinus]